MLFEIFFVMYQHLLFSDFMEILCQPLQLIFQLCDQIYLNTQKVLGNFCYKEVETPLG